MFQQDRWNDGGSNGDVVVVSNDGGASWHLAPSQPKFTICQGATSGSPGFFDRTTDPWLSFSSDGRIVYAIADSFNANGPAFGGASAILVSRSLDGGETWQTPVTARLDAVDDGTERQGDGDGRPVLAERRLRRLGPARLAEPEREPRRLQRLARRSAARRCSRRRPTSGVTWSQGRPIFDPGQNNQTIGNQIVVPTAGPPAGS